MRKLAWLVCAVLSIGLPAFAQQAAGGSGTPGSGEQPPAHPVTVDQVHEMLQLTGYVNLKKQMVSNMVPYLRQAMPFLPTMCWRTLRAVWKRRISRP